MRRPSRDKRVICRKTVNSNENIILGQFVEADPQQQLIKSTLGQHRRYGTFLCRKSGLIML